MMRKITWLNELWHYLRFSGEKDDYVREKKRLICERPHRPPPRPTSHTPFLAWSYLRKSLCGSTGVCVCRCPCRARAHFHSHSHATAIAPCALSLAVDPARSRCFVDFKADDDGKDLDTYPGR